MVDHFCRSCYRPWNDFRIALGDEGRKNDLSKMFESICAVYIWQLRGIPFVLVLWFQRKNWIHHGQRYLKRLWFDLRWLVMDSGNRRKHRTPIAPVGQSSTDGNKNANGFLIVSLQNWIHNAWQQCDAREVRLARGWNEDLSSGLGDHCRYPPCDLWRLDFLLYCFGLRYFAFQSVGIVNEENDFTNREEWTRF